MTISFTVPGVPIAWPRAKVSAHIIRVAGKLKAVATMYVPETEDIKKFKHDVVFAARGAMHERDTPASPTYPLATPCAMALTFVMPRTKAMTTVRKPMNREWFNHKPDIDNLSKGVLDALNGVVYMDDRQVCKLHVIKIYASGAEPPALHVVISELDFQP